LCNTNIDYSINIQLENHLSLAEQQKAVHIKIKLGNVEAEISCQPDQLKAAVENFISAIEGKEITITPKRIPEETIPDIVPRKKEETCKDLVTSFWREGWFGTARDLSEVHIELSRRGYHYDRTAIAHTLVDLVRDGLLTRQGEKGHYNYIQKKPP
jgi:hypothetical protein